jgi:hypothetical protein
MLQSVTVGASGSRPLANEPFSGLVFVEETVVNAVVVSEIVGKGRPMTVTTAAASPPVVPETNNSLLLVLHYFTFGL